MAQEKNDEMQDEFPESKHGEVGDVTITEYRKNQMVRLAECFVVSPLCIYTGIRYRKELPKWLSASLVVFGTATLLYNGSNFIVNWNRDGKLIRQAIKNKKEDEKKVRERIVNVGGETDSSVVSKLQEESPMPVAPILKKVSQPAPPVPVSEVKSNVESAPIKKEQVIPPAPATPNNKAEKKQEVMEHPIEITEATIVRPKYDNNFKQVIMSDVDSEPKITTANILSDVEVKENIELESDKKKEVEAVTITAGKEKAPDNKNGTDRNEAIG